MRTIKPGKVASTAGESQKRTNASSNRKIWDDFAASTKKSKKKREYEKGRDDRMVPTHSKATEPAPAPEQPFELEGPAYKPRDDFDLLEKNLGYEFKDRSLLQRALTHRSALGLKERADYERLEFLGDAVLDLSVAHLLSDHYPEAREGELSKMRAALVNTQALADIAKRLEIGPYIRLGRGEYSSGGAERPSILADVTEAIVGAMYRDSSYDTALETIREIFGSALQEVTPYDPKTELQEELHVAGSEPPTYFLELMEGPEHSPTFVTVVMVDGEIAGRGRGNTKKSSQQAAAAEALSRLKPTAAPLTLADGQSFVMAEALLTNEPRKTDD